MCWYDTQVSHVFVVVVCHVYLSCERGSDFPLAVRIGAVAGSADFQCRKHVAQVCLPLDLHVGWPLNLQGVPVG